MSSEMTAELKKLIVPENTLYEEGWNAALEVAMEHIDAARAGEGLDVERLARAMFGVTNDVAPLVFDNIGEAGRRIWLDRADLVAREYAALQSGAPDHE